MSGAELVAGILDRRFELCIWRRQHTAGHCSACGIPSPPASHVVLRGGPADGRELQLQDPPPPFVLIPGEDPVPWFLACDGAAYPIAVSPRPHEYRGTYTFSTRSRRRIYDYHPR